MKYSLLKKDKKTNNIETMVFSELEDAIDRLVFEVANEAALCDFNGEPSLYRIEREDHKIIYNKTCF